MVDISSSDIEDDSVHYGFIAKNVEAMNIAGLQHALDKIDELEAKVARLEKIIDRLDGGK